MEITVKKADRGDLTALLGLLYDDENRPVVDKRLISRFDDVLSQTNHSVLIAFCNKKAVATLSVTAIDSIAGGYPKAYLTCVKVMPGENALAVQDALLEEACKIASDYGCKRIKRAAGSYACKRVV